MSLAFTRHSSMNKSSVKGRDDLAIISFQSRQINVGEHTSLFAQR